MEVSPKARNFLWCACTNTLPVRAALKRRQIIEDAHCRCCPNSNETLFHALMGCERIQSLWVDYGCEAMIDGGEDMEFLDLFLKWILAQRIFRQVEDFNSYTQCIYVGLCRPHLSRPNQWCSSPDELVKINANAALNEEGWVGMSAMARDKEGKVLFSVVRRMKAWWPSDVAKAKAIHMAMCWPRKQGLSKVIIESDSQVIISRLSKAAIYYSDLDAILGDIIFLCSDFLFVEFSHVERDGNYVAHHLARVVPLGYEQCWVNHCPSVVCPYVLMDTLSLN
ncbi:uncharacterized protein LOC125498659 [Beta vulgaris subsp. vulgaris]|uniref:uncharacterized protein LOC125498659 n=1 Tax=Beta vulgaris subsp. vulgaris TaxID=3555 RepID=UPI002036D290|nr:uncharacterized protein LOC125498659 [Beta vulgaris subsp. vulgaris]